ncbi:MAG TPA: argininosuccinate lyase [Armatimonadota bacterium]|nr:argininosuccinate lyase [Armatimonadota bacterium]
MSKGLLWGGRFAAPPSARSLAFMSGRDVEPTPPYDLALAPYDLWVNRAHSLMLGRTGIVPAASVRHILRALTTLEERLAAGEFALDPAKEDVHSNVEAMVTELVGIEHAGHMHTGRSRNDQVVTDMRLYLRDRALEAADAILDLVGALIAAARDHAMTLMPGFTHHQHATATTWGHVTLAYAWAGLRQAQRLLAFLGTWNRCPLGSAASYGTTLPINRGLTAELLGFDGPEPNTLDSINSRWETAADLVHCLASMLTQLSSLSQTLILFSTREFRAVRIPDEYSAGSSIMPQKRNPQALEAIKAHAVMAQGAASTLMSLGGHNLFGYNTDQMWTKYVALDAIGGSVASIRAMAGVIAGLEVNVERLRELASRDFLGSTALAEALVSDGGVPFRIAKQVVEKAVALSEQSGEEQVTEEALRCSLAERGVEVDADLCTLVESQRAEAAVARLLHAGGAAPERVLESCGEAEGLRAALAVEVAGRAQAVRDAHAACREACDAF